ncbi:MAG TPA: hypothetical protein DDZ51_02305 [Planctomycetaceae bacterium]|nr:hypothetical protein [Planctomycetaceae bacterium]
MALSDLYRFPCDFESRSTDSKTSPLPNRHETLILLFPGTDMRYQYASTRLVAAGCELIRQVICPVDMLPSDHHPSVPTDS